VARFAAAWWRCRSRFWRSDFSFCSAFHMAS
jgi:hypothetical protein